VFFRTVEGGGRQEIRLRPGSYTVATHSRSRCGFWGGDTYKILDIKSAKRVVVDLTTQ
jgi:hypothetical protein